MSNLTTLENLYSKLIDSPKLIMPYFRTVCKDRNDTYNELLTHPHGIKDTEVIYENQYFMDLIKFILKNHTLPDNFYKETINNGIYSYKPIEKLANQGIIPSETLKTVLENELETFKASKKQLTPMKNKAGMKVKDIKNAINTVQEIHDSLFPETTDENLSNNQQSEIQTSQNEIINSAELIIPGDSQATPSEENSGMDF